MPNGCEMSRPPLGAGDAIYCSSRDKGGGATVGGAAPLMVRAAWGENQSMVQLAPIRAAAGGANGCYFFFFPRSVSLLYPQPLQDGTSIRINSANSAAFRTSGSSMSIRA